MDWEQARLEREAMRGEKRTRKKVMPEAGRRWNAVRPPLWWDDLTPQWQRIVEGYWNRVARKQDPQEAWVAVRPITMREPLTGDDPWLKAFLEMSDTRS